IRAASQLLQNGSLRIEPDGRRSRRNRVTSIGGRKERRFGQRVAVASVVQHGLTARLVDSHELHSATQDFIETDRALSRAEQCLFGSQFALGSSSPDARRKPICPSRCAANSVSALCPGGLLSDLRGNPPSMVRNLHSRRDQITEQQGIQMRKQKRMAT